MSTHLLFIIAFGTLLLGAVFWYTLSMSSMYDTKLDATSTEAAILENLELSNTYEGTFVSLRYPKDWVIRQATDESVHITSPDVVWEKEDGKGGLSNQPRELAMEGIPSGFWFRVVLSPSELSFEEARKSMQEMVDTYGGMYEIHTVSGKDALLSTTKPHGTFVWAQTYGHNPNAYIELNYPYQAPTLTEDQAIALMNALLATITLRGE